MKYLKLLICAEYVNFSVIDQIRKDVTQHRILIFKNQGTISGERHVEISRWFGELESTFYKHPKSPHPDVFRVSNDKNEGCTGRDFVYLQLSLMKNRVMCIYYNTLIHLIHQIITNIYQYIVF